MSKAPVVKRVKAYPFEATLEQAGQKKPIEVTYMNENGVIVDLKLMFVQVGDHLPVNFVIPVLGHAISAVTRVIKTYDKALDPKSQKISRMAELYFENLNENQRNYIRTFMAAIGQSR